MILVYLILWGLPLGCLIGSLCRVPPFYVLSVVYGGVGLTLSSIVAWSDTPPTNLVLFMDMVILSSLNLCVGLIGLLPGGPPAARPKIIRPRVELVSIEGREYVTPAVVAAEMLAMKNTIRYQRVLIERYKVALTALEHAADIYAADQSGATDPRCGLHQPVSVADGEALNEALKLARSMLTDGAGQEP